MVCVGLWQGPSVADRKTGIIVKVLLNHRRCTCGDETRFRLYLGFCSAFRSVDG